MKPIRYTIVPKQPAAHIFEVTVTVAEPDPSGQRFMLPVWIPGSYMVREFARNIVTLRAFNDAGRKVRIEKTDKHAWQAAPVKGALTLRYEVYAWDLSVRAAHLDDTVGFFNGTSVFLAALGHETAQHVVDIQRPDGHAYRHWRVGTALTEARGTKRYGFGEYTAADYDELIDHPVTLGEFTLASFKAHGVPHDIVIAKAALTATFIPLPGTIEEPPPHVRIGTLPRPSVAQLTFSPGDSQPLCVNFQQTEIMVRS